MKGTKRLAVLAMFTAIALTIFVAEAQIPPVVPIPGVKLGLANIVTLIAMALHGRRQAGEILLVRIVLGSVFTGGVSAMLFSIAGGVLAYLVMCLTIRRLSERGVVKNENAVVSSLISKEQAQASRLDEMVEETFQGSMPAFIAAFSRSRKLTRDEVEQLKALIDNYEEDRT